MAWMRRPLVISVFVLGLLLAGSPAALAAHSKGHSGSKPVSTPAGRGVQPKAYPTPPKLKRDAKAVATATSASGDSVTIYNQYIGVLSSNPVTTYQWTGSGWVGINCLGGGPEQAYAGQQLVPICAYIELTDANAQPGGESTATNTYQSAIYDACGTLIGTSTSYGWHDFTNEYAGGWVANLQAIPTIGTACFGQWTAALSYTQTFYDGTTLTATGTLAFTAYESPHSDIAANYPQGPLTGGAVTPQEQLGGCACGGTTTHSQATAHPIDTATGNFWHSFSDFAIPGRGPALSLTRTYNSLQAANNSPFGYGWTDSYGMSLTLSGSTTTVNQENGSQITFTANGSAWSAPPRALATLAHNGDGTWTLTRQAKTVFTFDSGGRLTAIRDLNGYTTTLTYPSAAQMVVTDPAGRSLTFALAGGHVTSVADSSTPQRTVTYSYDTAGNLTDVVDVGGGHWQFTYDSAHLMLTMRSPRFYGDTTTSPAPVVTNHYDSSGRIDWQSDQLGRRTTFDYSSIANATRIVDPAGGVEVDEYQSGLLTAQLKGYGSAQESAIYYRYDGTTAQPSVVIDGDGNATTYTYDSRGDVLTATDALNRTTTYTYNSLGEVLTKTEPLKFGSTHASTTYTYDAAGNPLTVSSPLLDPAGNVTTTSVTHYTYGDSAHPGDVTAIADPNGITTQQTFDAYGDLTSVTDGAGDKTTYAYDTSRGLRTSMTSPKGNASGGNPATTTATFSYDAYGHLTVTKDPMWSSSAPALHKQVNGYDADGNPTTVTDGAGHTTTTTFDAAGEVVSVQQGDGSTTRNDYNGDGTLRDQVDGDGQTTSYTYDAAKHLSTTTDPKGVITTTSYDGAGNLISTLDSAGQTTNSYDAANELTATTYNLYYTPWSHAPDLTNVSYDADGQRIAQTDGTGTTTWSWDSLHRLTSTTNGAGATVGYSYDIGGRQIGVTYPGSTGTVTRAYDNANRVKTVTDWANHATNFSYDADSNIQAEIYPNGTTATYGYDATDRMANATAAPTANPAIPFAQFAYTRGGDGTVTGTTSTGVPADNHSYTYDAAGRLSGVDSAQYGYDGAGNLTTLPGGVQQAYDAADKLTLATSKPAIQLVGTASAGDSTSKTLTIQLPTGTTAGDEVVVSATLDVGHSATFPTGYSSAGTFTSGTKSTNEQVAVDTHTVGAGETSVTVTFDAKINKTVAVAVYRNMHSAAPVDVTASYYSAAATTSLTVQGVNTTSDGDRLLLITAADGKSGTWTPPSNFTTRVQQAGGSTDSLLADQALGAAGATTGGTATHTTSSQAVSVVIALRHSQSSYGYDRKAERTSSLDVNGNVGNLVYDQAGRLSTFGGTTYQYGAGNLRASSTTGGVTTKFTWDPTTSTPQLLQAGSWSYIYGPDGNPIEQVNGSTTNYFIHDQLGSTRLLTDPTGGVVASFTYSAYGSLAGRTGTADTSLKWNGQYLDSESGLYYLRARYYDPASAQFLTVDPLYRVTGSRYGYTYGNPLNAADPLGLGCGITSPLDCAGDLWNAATGAASGALHQLSDATNATLDALGDAADAVVKADEAIANGIESAADYVAKHPGQIVVIVAGVTAIVAASILTAGLADALLEAGATIYAEESIAASVEGAEFISHAPLVLAPGATVAGLGGYGVYAGVTSLANSSNSSGPSCP